MPASRRARAITLAPRSWPSSPGLATSTRIGGRMLEMRRLLVSPEHVAERIADLAERRVGPDRVEDVRHRVLGALGGAAERVERARHSRIIAPGAERGQFLFLVFARGFVYLEQFDGLVLRLKAIHSD